MKSLATIFLFTLTLSAQARFPEVRVLRDLYYQAPVDEVAALRFQELMASVKADSSPLLVCYRGVSLLIEARHAFNPFTKWASFSRGKELIEQAVDRDPGNTEIRFLRFCVQTNLPCFLHYSSDTGADKKVLMNQYRSLVDPDLKLRIRDYMLQQGHCSDAEKSAFL